MGVGVINRQDDPLLALRSRTRKQGREGPNASTAEHSVEIQPAGYAAQPPNKQAVVAVNKKLRAKCLEHKKTEEELSHKLSKLTRELEEARHEYARMFSELQSLEAVKPDNGGV